MKTVIFVTVMKVIDTTYLIYVEIYFRNHNFHNTFSLVTDLSEFVI